MKPIKFVGQNVIFAANQPEYLPLPAHKDDNGLVTTCWSLSLIEKIKLLCGGKIWFQSLTFNKPLQPQLFSVSKPAFSTRKE